MRVTKETAYLLGAFKDGSIYHNKKEGIYRIRLYQNSREWLVNIQNIFQETFNKKLYLRKDPRKNLWYLEINDKKLFGILSNLLSESVPLVIGNAPIEIKKGFIKGVFDTEGGIFRIEEYESNPKKLKKELQDIRIRFGQANRELLEFVKKTLEELGINCGKVCGPYFKDENSKGYFELNSYGIENMRRFSYLIGTRHPVKAMRIAKIDAFSKKAE